MQKVVVLIIGAVFALMSQEILVGKDCGGGAYKNILEVSLHAGLLILLGLGKHLAIKLK